MPSPLYLCRLDPSLVAKDLVTQWHDAVWSAKRPLLVLPPSVDTDMFAASCALGHALRNTGKDVTILCPRPMSAHAQFLIGALEVTSSLEETKSYTCIFPPELRVLDAMHELFAEGGGSVTLKLAPDTSPQLLSSLTFSSTLPSFDRVIAMGAQDLSEIAPLFGDAHALLSHVPLVSFSWQPSTEHFGRWNVFYEQAKTLCEVVTLFLQETAIESVKDHVATCALTGIIAKTKHFRTDLVTPHMLNVSADLVAAGAERLKIIEELYRTRSVDTLRLWGTACARLQEISSGVLFSELTQDDFLRTHTSPDVLLDIAQEVLQSSEKTQEIIFFFPQDGLLHARVVAKLPRDARTFIGALRTEGTKDAALHIFGKDISSLQVLQNLKP